MNNDVGKFQDKESNAEDELGIGLDGYRPVF